MAPRPSAPSRSPRLESRKRHAVKDDVHHERPPKKMKTLLDEADFSGDEQSTARTTKHLQVSVNSPTSNEDTFTINQDFARRFEHNKEREELQRLEEKYDNLESSTDSEEEDDEGILASGALDAQVTATLEAIRKKDPRVYDDKMIFYTDPELAQDDVETITKKEKPMYLSDYHRRNLLEEKGHGEEETEDAPATYVQQQDHLKNVIAREMHAAVGGDKNFMDDFGTEDDSDNGFLIRKPSTLQDTSRARSAELTQRSIDVETADRDPETYLSNFMSTRAWVPSDGSKFQPFESDDEEEERRAEAFEEAYNLRFEDPRTSNEKLLSHARDAAAKYSVRKEEMNTRKKAREAERVKKDAARQIREEDKARMRKLKVAQAEGKINQIKEAAGLRGESLKEEDWSAFLEEGWEDARWEQEMKKRFGDDYYADHDLRADDNVDGKGRRRMKKPKWEDDIDIGDLVPDFDAAEQEEPTFSLTEEESDAGGVLISSTQQGDPEENPDGRRTAKRKREKEEQKRSVRKERQRIEHLVDKQIEVDETLSNFGKKHAGHFRYRETSPTAYGLTAQDILMASDSQLNQYAGLKKMAAFRDPEKKRKDKKHLSKKARLRQWRKDTFGSDQGPQIPLAEVIAGQEIPVKGSKMKEGLDVNIREGKKKRTRSKKSKAYSNAR